MDNKICMLTSVHRPFDTRIFQKQAISLVRRGFNVTLVAPHDKNGMVEGVKISALRKVKNRFARISILMVSILRIAKQENADIYHIHDPELLPIGKLLKKHGKVVIYDMHENLPKQILYKEWITPCLRKYVAWLVSLVEKYFLSDMPVIFAEYSYEKDYPWIENYTTVLNMPLKDQLKPLEKNSTSFHDNGHPVVGYLGSVTEARGGETILKALAILKSNDLEVRFECVGHMKETYRDKLCKLCEEYDLRDIILHGYRTPMEGWSLIKRCDIGLALLHPIPNYLYSYPTKLFEYMALGIPVIASNFPLWREIIEGNNCGICVDPLQPVEIAGAIDRLVKNPDLAQEMGRNGRLAVEEKYNWANEEKKLLALYEQLLS